jgi:hypothetical protein
VLEEGAGGRGREREGGMGWDGEGNPDLAKGGASEKYSKGKAQLCAGEEL